MQDKEEKDGGPYNNEPLQQIATEIPPHEIPLPPSPTLSVDTSEQEQKFASPPIEISSPPVEIPTSEEIRKQHDVYTEIDLTSNSPLTEKDRAPLHEYAEHGAPVAPPAPSNANTAIIVEDFEDGQGDPKKNLNLWQKITFSYVTTMVHNAQSYVYCDSMSIFANIQKETT